MPREDLNVWNQLDTASRLRLMKFVCSFAWADLQVNVAERAFVAQLIRRLSLDEEERKKVRGWLEIPPSPDSVDPGLIPPAHRKVFLEAIEGVIIADGEIAPEERENLQLLQELLA